MKAGRCCKTHPQTGYISPSFFTAMSHLIWIQLDVNINCYVSGADQETPCQILANVKTALRTFCTHKHPNWNHKLTPPKKNNSVALKGFPCLLICPHTLIFRDWCKEAAICDPVLLRIMRWCQGTQAWVSRRMLVNYSFWLDWKCVHDCTYMCFVLKQISCVCVCERDVACLDCHGWEWQKIKR